MGHVYVDDFVEVWDTIHGEYRIAKRSKNMKLSNAVMSDVITC